MTSAADTASIKNLLPVWHSLDKCVAMMNEGRYEAATTSLRALLDTTRQRGLNHTAWEGRVLLATARAKFQLEDNSGTQACLLGVTQEVLHGSPELYCEYFALRGLLRRRESHGLWKSGDARLAHAHASDAVDCFLATQEMAHGSELQLQRLNARLNELNTRGLLAAIDGISAVRNRELFVDAAITECRIRAWTPAALDNPVTGMTILADLARPLDLDVDGTRELSDAPEFRAACLQLFGPETSAHGQSRGWPDMLLAASRAIDVPPICRARGLILGASLLLEKRHEASIVRLKRSYQYALADARASLRIGYGHETATTDRLRHLIHDLDELTGGPQFPHIAIFR